MTKCCRQHPTSIYFPSALWIPNFATLWYAYSVACWEACGDQSGPIGTNRDQWQLTVVKPYDCGFAKDCVWMVGIWSRLGQCRWLVGEVWRWRFVPIVQFLGAWNTASWLPNWGTPSTNILKTRGGLISECAPPSQPSREITIYLLASSHGWFMDNYLNESADVLLIFFADGPKHARWSKAGTSMQGKGLQCSDPLK